MDSIARRVSIRGGLILVAALVLVGALTGVLLHTRAVRALDQALLAAAVGRAHPDVNAEVEFEPVHSPIRTWLIRHDDHRISAEVADRTREHDGPLYLDDGLDRLVLLPFEVEAGHQESKGVAAASARRVTLAASVGPFALIYAVLAGVVALGATLMHRNTVRRAFLPLDQTRRELASVVGLSESGLLTEVGPVEVRSLVVAINSLLLRLKSAHEAQARFTAEAAHELRTPVTSMLGELDVALRCAREADADQALLTSLREEVQRLRQIVEGLTSLARLDAGHVERDTERLRGAELATAAFAREERSLVNAGCVARLEIEDDPELDGHEALLLVALTNLLRNAARHAPGATVVMRVTRNDDCAVFTVDDDGPGLAVSSEMAFDRFSRGTSARTFDRSGLGLGLPIAREIARRHQGDCTLSRSELGGVRATLTVRALPAT